MFVFEPREAPAADVATDQSLAATAASRIWAQATR
jgi:hypothetical protein